ncbi:hypothetical protein Ciccas_012122 [Cichlidogyrus casuarinus]|uniref:Uncharacterized protein n=1 Tax=Cichlidogyrus casuarinus TaxID=1844966 RepID=A0ABD2PQP5_9PLAT
MSWYRVQDREVENGHLVENTVDLNSDSPCALSVFVNLVNFQNVVFSNVDPGMTVAALGSRVATTWLRFLDLDTKSIDQDEQLLHAIDKRFRLTSKSLFLDTMARLDQVTRMPNLSLQYRMFYVPEWRQVKKEPFLAEITYLQFRFELLLGPTISPRGPFLLDPANYTHECLPANKYRWPDHTASRTVMPLVGLILRAEKWDPKAPNWDQALDFYLRPLIAWLKEENTLGQRLITSFRVCESLSPQQAKLSFLEACLNMPLHGSFSELRDNLTIQMETDDSLSKVSLNRCYLSVNRYGFFITSNSKRDQDVR